MAEDNVGGDGGIEAAPGGGALAGQVGLCGLRIEQGEEVEVRRVGCDQAEAIHHATAVGHIAQQVGQGRPALDLEQGIEELKGILHWQVDVHQTVYGQHEQTGVVGGGQDDKDEALAPIAGLTLLAIGEGGLVAVMTISDVQLLTLEPAADGGDYMGIVDAPEAVS